MAKTILAASAFAVVLAGATAAFAAEPGAAGATGAKSDEPAVTSAAATTSPPAAEAPSWEAGLSVRRAGFALGLAIGGSVGEVSGYPNDIRKVGKYEFLADTGPAFGGHGTLWLGGALTDWLVFGLGLGASRAYGGGAVVTGFTFVFHTEIFPLFTLGGVWRELGVAFDTGAGNFVGELENKPAGAAGKLVAPLIDSGAASRVGVGVFYDGLRLGSKVSTGPFVAFDYSWSGTMSQPLVLVGLRTALYAKGKR
jgi:hypothetical protein